jgi:hypothetical protein
MEDHETRRKIIREWMALPKEKRQTEEQVAAFAKKAVQQNEFHRSRRDPSQKFRRDPYQKLMGWLTVPIGPGMTIFSPDGKYGYVCSSFTPETEVITVADHRIVGKVPQTSPFCPNIAATPDSKQVWFTLKDSGKTQVFDAQPPFALLKTLDTGPITNHVNIVRNANGTFRASAEQCPPCLR